MSAVALHAGSGQLDINWSAGEAKERRFYRFDAADACGNIWLHTTENWISHCLYLTEILLAPRALLCRLPGKGKEQQEHDQLRKQR